MQDSDIKKNFLKGEQLDARWNRFIEQGLAVSLLSTVEHWSRCIRIRGFIMMNGLDCGRQRRGSHGNVIIFEIQNSINNTSTGSSKVQCTIVHYDKFHNVLRRGYLDDSQSSTGSTPSNSYFRSLGVLPVLLYHCCGS